LLLFWLFCCWYSMTATPIILSRKSFELETRPTESQLRRL
jgi:hypothetical protein